MKAATLVRFLVETGARTVFRFFESALAHPRQCVSCLRAHSTYNDRSLRTLKIPCPRFGQSMEEEARTLARIRSVPHPTLSLFLLFFFHAQQVCLGLVETEFCQRQLGKEVASAVTSTMPVGLTLVFII